MFAGINGFGPMAFRVRPWSRFWKFSAALLRPIMLTRSLVGSCQPKAIRLPSNSAMPIAASAIVHGKSTWT
jgi:hypothetical protein